MTKPFAIAFLALLAATAAGPAAAQPKPETPPVTPAQEASAVEFAKAHHPELAELLDRLEASDRDAYVKAVGDISGTSERMARLREADPRRYELVVRNWTFDSRVRLLTARLTMSDDAALRGELKELLRERQQGKLALLRLDRERTAAKLKKLEAQINQLERGQAAAVEQDFARIDRAVKTSARDRRRPDGDDKPKPTPKKKPLRKKPAPADGARGE